MPKRWFFLFLFPSTLLLFVLIFIRVVDIDELAFLTAAFETLKGRIPYRDFFLPQMPLSFLLLIPFASSGITGFFLGRAFNVLLGIVFGLLLLYYLHRRKVKTSFGVTFILLLYFANGLFLAWIPVNKPHILVNIFNLLSLLCLYTGNYFLSGIFFGLAGETRIIFLSFLPFYLYFIWRYKGKRQIIPFLIGFALPQSLGLYFLLASPNNFLTHTIYYHLVRGAPSSCGLASRFACGEILYHRLIVLGKIFALPQNLILIILTIFAFPYYWPAREKYSLEFFSLALGATTFFIYYLVVAPAHFQYFIQVIPYLLVFNIPYVASFPLRGVLQKKPLFSVSWLTIILILYLATSFFVIYNYTGNFRSFYQKYQVSLIKKVTEEIEDASRPGDRILVFNPNLQVLAKRQNLTDYETCPDFPFAERFSEPERRALNLSSSEDIREKIRRGYPSLVVGILGEEEVNFYELEKSGYKKIKEIEPYQIYKRQ